MTSICTSCKHKDACERDRRIIGYPNFRVTECKEYERKGGDNGMTREEAIDFLKEEKFKNVNSKYRRDWNDASDMAIEALSAEAVQGKWIMHIDDLFPCESTQECSVCHAEQLISISDDNFCPNCGADMRGGENE